MLANRYFVIAEAIAGGYIVISILLSFKSLFWRLLVILDMVHIAMKISSFFPLLCAYFHENINL
jgi:hypothetical protein